MRNRTASTIAVLALLAAGLGGGAAQAAPAAAAPQERPLATLPYTPGLDLEAMDRSVDPCVDFYRYACGGWERANPLPADQSVWDVYRKLADANQRFLWGILDGLAKPPPRRTPAQQKIGDYFSACMDAAAVERHGSKPLHPWFAAIDRLRTRRDLAPLLARLHAAFNDEGLFFGFTSNQDFEDATRVIAFADAGGLGLPERDYYTRDDEKSKALRERYVEHVTRMFRLLGHKPDVASREAAVVMSMETALAQASLSLVERRDPYKVYHKVSAAGLQALTPGFDWPRYLRDVGVPGVATLNVTQPDFYRALDREWSARSLDDLRTYLRWHVVRSMAPYLSSAFVDENFAFYGRTLRGAEQLRPRWKRCVTLVDAQIGEALGQEYVRHAFGPELKDRTRRMASQIEAAMRSEIEGLDWMSAATKERAKEKLATLVNKVGYPDRWRDYSTLDVMRHDFAGNVVRANRFEFRRQLAKIGKPLDRGEWLMTPPTVNAYYDPQLNDINFPAGVLQPPLYDPRLDDAPNYGDTGWTIGHELTHGFDDHGRQFDARGDLKDWWTPADAKAFESRAACLVEQYGQYVAVDDVKVNSKATLGEDVADLGGALLAWLAWKAQTADSAAPSRDGLTPEQRFFIGGAQGFCTNQRPEERRLRALSDVHSPDRYRVNGVLSNMPEFAQAFACKPGQPMVRETRCRVW